MKALRKIAGKKIKKGQMIPDGVFSDEEIKTLVKYGFIELEKKKTVKKKAKKEAE